MTERNVPIQSLIDHIKTAFDVDPWAKEMAEELLKEQQEEIENLKQTCQSMMEGICLLKEQEPLAVCEGKVNKCVCGNEINRYWHPEYCGFCGKKLVWY